MSPDPFPLEFTIFLGMFALFLLGWGNTTDSSDSSSEEDESPDFPNPLEGVFTDPTPAEVQEPPEMHAITEVNTHRDGEPIYVPEIWMMVDSHEVAWEYVEKAAEELYPAFDEYHIRRVEFHCMSEENEDCFCYKLALTSHQAKRVATDERYTLSGLKDDVEMNDNGDDVIPPVDWIECDQHREPRDVSGSTTGGGAIAAAAGASAAGAAGGCAGAGAAGGGAC